MSVIEQNVKFDRIKESESITNMKSYYYTVSINSNAHLHYGTKLGHVIKHQLVTGILYAGFIIGLIAGFNSGLVAGLVGADNVSQTITGGIGGAIAGTLAVAICIYGAGEDRDPMFNIGLINDVRYLAMILFVIFLSPGVIELVTKVNITASVGAVGGAFAGSHIVGISVKDFRRDTVLAIALGALMGTAIGATGGTSIIGIISGAITAGAIVVWSDYLQIVYLKVVVTTGTFSEAIKDVLMTVEREDMKAAIIGVLIGGIFTYQTTNNGAVIGAVAGAIALNTIWNVGGHDEMPYTIITVVASIFVYFRYSGIVLDEGVTGAVIGILTAGCLSLNRHWHPDNPNT